MTRICTDVEQSKKLDDILSTESADMYWLHANGEYCCEVSDGPIERIEGDIPAWSLVALMDMLPYPQLSKDKLGSGKEGWMVSVYPDNCRYDSSWHDNPIDACVEMIYTMHEQNML